LFWPAGGFEKQGPLVLQPCPSRVVASAGQAEMSMREQKRDLRSLFLSSVKFCQPLVAVSMSAVTTAYAEGGSGRSGAVLEDGGAGLTSFVWSDPKARISKTVAFLSFTLAFIFQPSYPMLCNSNAGID